LCRSFFLFFRFCNALLIGKYRTPKNAKKRETITPMIAAKTPPAIPGPIYAKLGLEKNKDVAIKKKILWLLIITSFTPD
tara:strand:- start:65543 stop:65779 length:237 start_codon:yes stop_codon:yes gene_type:complete